MIWGLLFMYLEKYFDWDKYNTSNCYNDHTHTRDFCRINNIDFDELYLLLSDLGGCCCDCEVYYNVNHNVDHNSEIPIPTKEVYQQ